MGCLINSYVADFETITKAPSYVWSWCINKVGTNDFEYGNNIVSFLNYCKKLVKDNTVNIYFHNLKFDSEFIIWYLLKNGYTHVEKVENLKEFSTLITDKSQYFSLEFGVKRKGKDLVKVKFLDSLKLLPFSVEEIAKVFNLEISKLSIDYDKYRSKNHILTDDEKNYIKNDVSIVSKALLYLDGFNFEKMTLAGNALNNFKKDTKYFNYFFPVLDYEIDSYIRKAYRGGFTYLSPKFESKEIGSGIVLDVNSLYPSIMYNEFLPIGNPKYFKGKYKLEEEYPLYISHISCSFEIKRDYIPSIQLKGNMIYCQTDYITSTNGNIEDLYLTNIDLKIFLKHYDVKNLTYIDGFKFMSKKGIFRNYIDYWTKIKIKAKEDGNKPLYTMAKLMLNSLYGKFGTNPKHISKIPFIKDNIVKYKYSDETIGDSIYTALAVFVTSYGRAKTISIAQSVFDRYIYSDTDSIHLEGCEIPNNIDIHNTKLGYWSIDGKFEKAKYLRAKTYIYQSKDKLKVVIAGMPLKMKKFINFENFKKGVTFTSYSTGEKNEILIPKENAKLSPKRVEGGVILEEVPFSIKI